MKPISASDTYKKDQIIYNNKILLLLPNGDEFSSELRLTSEKKFPVTRLFFLSMLL